MSAKLVVSLDFELMWGVRDHRSSQDYGDAVIGARKAIPDMLKRFSKHGICATWATVGLLFARTKDEMLDYAPVLLPGYHNELLSPYDFIARGVGKDEKEDPLHFGRSLVDQIGETPGQELASHTYSHYYCMEPGQTTEAFASDIKSALAIARNSGHSIRSIVFPRNQMLDAHVQCCRDLGILNFRGNPEDFLYRPRSGKENTMFVRGLRFLDAVVPVSRQLSYSSPATSHGTSNVRASRFLRPWNPQLRLYSMMHLQRVKAEMEHAAKSGHVYHLWWHPHNMGRNMEQNFKQLDAIISTFQVLRDKYDMKSVTMENTA